MNNKAGSPRSFNTVKRSNRKERLYRRMQSRIVLLAICAVLILLMVTGMIFLICHLASSSGGRTPSNPNSGNDPNTPTDPSGIRYQLETKLSDEVYTGDLVVVNNSYIYRFPNIQLDSILQYRERIDGKVPYSVPNVTNPPQMQPVMADQLNRLLTAFYNMSGDNSLVVYSAHRTREQQESYSTAPGYSEHHTGLLVALSSSTTKSELNTADYKWIFDNCHRYGFIQRYPTGKSTLTQVNSYTECLRYVGIAHATYIKNNNLCLEEYTALLKNNHSTTTGTDGVPLRIDVNGDGKNDYAVYYVAANTANTVTTIPVPANYAYTVSGDNMGGFIVTVDLNNPTAA